MDKIKKKQILNDCNNNNFTIDKLDQWVISGDITLEEFELNRLDPSKLEILRQRKEQREGTFIIEDAPTAPTNFFEETIFVSDTPPLSVVPPQGGKIAEIQKVINNEVGIEEIKDAIRKGIYTYNDLLAAGIPQRIINAMEYHSQRKPVRPMAIEDLPPMDKGRTDVFFIGIAGSGKSVMLGGLLRYANKEGIMIPDSYNQEGNKYAAHLTSDLEKGILPLATTAGSYNYIAASIKDSKKVPHPLNIVEVPGENYHRIFEEGIENEEVKGFVNYIKNDNRKILIFVLDALEHKNRLENSYSSAYKQGDIYVAILSMLKSYKILEKTDALYIVVNKFDVLKKEQALFSSQSDAKLADDFVKDEFKNLLNNCIDAKENSCNKFPIKVFPFSIGEVCYDKILKEYNTTYSKNIVEQILSDSFVVSGDGFLSKFLKRF